MFEIIYLYILRTFVFILNHNANGRSNWHPNIVQLEAFDALSERFSVLTAPLQFSRKVYLKTFILSVIVFLFFYLFWIVTGLNCFNDRSI